MQRFLRLQAKCRELGDAVSSLLFELKYKYGDTFRAPAKDRKRLEQLRAREPKAQDAFFSWLDCNSPRDWRHGCPVHWICSELTYADAITAGQLSVVPPCCYGAMPHDMVRFAAPVQSAA